MMLLNNSMKGYECFKASLHRYSIHHVYITKHSSIFALLTG